MPETLPSPLSTPELTPPTGPVQINIGDDSNDGGNGGILVPILVILVLIYFFGPLSWRSFLRTAKDNILEEVKITVSKLQSKNPEVPSLILTPAVSETPKTSSPSSDFNQ